MNTSTKTTRSKVLLAVAGSLLALVSALSAAPLPAAADAPVITTQVIRVTTPVPFEVTCPTFNVLWTVTIERQNITFYENGSPVRQIRHVHTEGTFYNATTSYSVPFDGAFTRTEDYVENTATYTGRHLRVHIPGRGTLALDVGNRIVDVSVNPPQILFAAGQHEFAAQLCQILNP